MSTDVNQQPRARIQAERFDDEVVLRFPSLSRLMRVVLPNEAVTHIRAAQREQLLALRAVLDAATHGSGRDSVCIMSASPPEVADTSAVRTLVTVGAPESSRV